ncbi:MAG: hypothetical protein IPL05_13255 [Betaproteobacteria bacterium]|nr:hypothetical protein [Betaproteobacteria bacterium]
MSEKEHHDVDRTACVADLKRFLAEARDLRLAAAADPVRGQRRDRLRAWQAARLAKTHADLLASPKFNIAATFFLSDLYGPKDFSERDTEMEKVLPIMTTMLPVSGLRTLLLAVEVDALSERFDAEMVAVLGKRLDQDGLAMDDYAAAYRQVGDRDGRELQICLIGETGEALDALAHKTFAGAALKLMHGPAQLAGLGELHAFLERGFNAFRSLRRADEFLETIVQRERELMVSLFTTV